MTEYDELAYYLYARERLAECAKQRAAIAAIERPLETRCEEILKKWGSSGRTFRINGVVLQANKHHEYPSLREIIIEDLD